MAAKIDRILAAHPNWKRRDLEAVLNAQTYHNYDRKTGRATMLNLLHDVCQIIMSNGVALEKKHFEDGIKYDSFKNLSNEIKDAVDIFNGFFLIYQNFCAKFGNNLMGFDRVYGYFHVDAHEIGNSLFWLDLLHCVEMSKNDVGEEDANSDCVAALRQACGSFTFPSIQLVEYASPDFAQSAEALIIPLFTEDENGRKQNEICPAKYRFADELLNLAVGSFLLIKGLMFGRNEQVKLPQKNTCDDYRRKQQIRLAEHTKKMARLWISRQLKML